MAKRKPAKSKKAKTTSKKNAKEATITSIMTEERVYKPSKKVISNSYIKSPSEYEKIYKTSLTKGDSFWAEKAKELVNKFQFEAKIEYVCRPLSVRELSKQCAMIAVDEILKSRPVLPSPIAVDSIDKCTIQAKDFWQQVRKAITEL